MRALTFDDLTTNRAVARLLIPSPVFYPFGLPRYDSVERSVPETTCIYLHINSKLFQTLKPILNFNHAERNNEFDIEKVARACIANVQKLTTIRFLSIKLKISLTIIQL